MAVTFTEHAFTFACDGESLLGIIAEPAQSKPTGVLVVVGGPQYRVGSHRQFLLLARALAKAGYPVMRFDSSGMGDSTGELRSFETINGNIAAAISAFQKQCPAIESIVLWGLCDAASASLLYIEASQDSRLSGLVLLNPWVRSETTLARAHIKHYYGQRLLEAQFWRKLLTGQVRVDRAVADFIRNWMRAQKNSSQAVVGARLSFPQKMARGLDGFAWPVLLILSGNDYTAKEFLDVIQTDPVWSGALARSTVTRTTLEGADHTFSSAEFRKKVEQITLQWLETVNTRSNIPTEKASTQ